MEFRGTIFVGDAINDSEIWSVLPPDLQSFYTETNGIVAFQGGLHIRGCVKGPDWHCLRAVWEGPHALWKMFSSLRESDVPFAQDVLGDQYFLRLGTVWNLMAETGEVEDLEIEFFDFLEDAIDDPVEFLSLEPLVFFLECGKHLEPGYLLRPDPPFSVEAEEYTFEKVPVFDRLADFAERH